MTLVVILFMIINFSDANLYLIQHLYKRPFILVRPKRKKEGGGIWLDSDKYITLYLKI